MKKGIQIGGASLSVNGVFHSGTAMVYRAPVHRFALGADEIYSSEPEEGHSPLRVLAAAEAGVGAAKAGDGVAVRVELSCKDSDREIVRKPVLWLVAPAAGGPVRVYEDGKWEKPVASVEIGRWTERIDLQVATAGGAVAAAMRLKLLAGCGGRKARIYATAVSAIRDGRVAPQNAAPELAGLKSFPMPTPVFLSPYSAQYLDMDSQLELLAMNGDWHIEALGVLLRRRFDLFVFHDNDVDWAEHALTSHARKGVSRARMEAMIDRAYLALDRRLAAILKALPADTTLLVMSQHGIIAPWDRRGGESTPAILEKPGCWCATARRLTTTSRLPSRRRSRA
ncbi:MAG: alkaline phosphatase family protein [Bryobacterales bacterium]|nr:alkaline phosphatase family protein [Bryobacterales bacterium]